MAFRPAFPSSGVYETSAPYNAVLAGDAGERLVSLLAALVAEVVHEKHFQVHQGMAKLPFGPACRLSS